MDMPFKLCIIEHIGDEEKENDVTQHFSLRGEEPGTMKLRENSVFDLLFQAPPMSKLYIDELEVYDPSLGQVDAHGFYLQPSEEVYPVCSMENKKPPPFIPGRYLVTMFVEGDWYDAILEIIPRRMSEHQHDRMVEELEAIEKGLAMQEKEKRHFQQQLFQGVLSSKEERQLQHLIQEKSKFLLALRRIIDTPYEEIQKQHVAAPMHRIRRMDEKAYRLTQATPRSHVAYSAQSVFVRDVQENRLLKSLLLQLLQLFQRLRSELDWSTDVLQAVWSRYLLPIRQQVLSFLQTPWVQKVEKPTSLHVPPLFFTGSAYASVYRILTKPLKTSQSVTKTTRKQYKRSDELYELWGYMQLVQMIQRQGYEVVREKTIMTDDKRVWTFQRGEVILRLAHDEEIPRNPEKITREVPYFTLFNNRPDGRLDVWVSGQLYGSVIIDFKYRNSLYIWSESALESNGEVPSTMQQLEAYASNIRTDFSYLQLPSDPLIELRPVSEVWVIYPTKYDTKQRELQKNAYGIRLLDMSPTLDYSYLEQLLQTAIEQIKKRKQ